MSIPSFVLIALAGIWPIIWHLGTGVGLIVLLLAAAWFSPVFKTKFLYGAALVGAVLIAFATGVVDGDRRVRAQWTASLEATIKSGEKIRADSERAVARKPLDRVRGTDRFNRDKH